MIFFNVFKMRPKRSLNVAVVLIHNNCWLMGVFLVHSANIFNPTHYKHITLFDKYLLSN